MQAVYVWGSTTTRGDGFSPYNIVKVTNNEGAERQIDSITVKIGACASGTGTANGNVTGNGHSVVCHLEGGGCNSDDVTVAGNIPLKNSSLGKYFDYKECSSVTFNFTNKPIIAAGASITFNLAWSGNAMTVHTKSSKPNYAPPSCSASDTTPPEPPYVMSVINSSSIDKQIIRVNVSKFHVNFNVSAGNEMWNTEVKGFTWDSVGYVSSGACILHRTRDCTEKQNTTFNESFEIVAGYHEMSDGSRYKIKAIVADVDRSQNPEQWWAAVGAPNGDDIQTGWSLYTFQEPKLKSESTAIGEKGAHKSYTFSLSETNNRVWSSLENEFTTRYRVRFMNSAGTAWESWSGWTDIGNTTSWARTEAQLRLLFPKAYDHRQAQIEFKRHSSSAPDSNDNYSVGWYSTNSKTYSITLNYRPRKGVTTANTSYKKNNNSGTGISKDAVVINDNSLSGIYVSWTYTTDADTNYDAGYTQGYRIRLYNKDSTVVKTYYTTNKYYTIPKADIPKMQHTFIDITPYFANNQAAIANSAYANNYWYYNGTIEKSKFVILMGKLAKPVITYPVEGSNWINQKYRVCFQLPTDPDKGSESSYETTYHYEDIEIQINGTHTYRMKNSTNGATASGTCTTATNIFSSTQANLTYQRKIVVCPRISIKSSKCFNI